jgi:hypothetical protein
MATPNHTTPHHPPPPPQTHTPLSSSSFPLISISAEEAKAEAAKKAEKKEFKALRKELRDANSQYSCSE